MYVQRRFCVEDDVTYERQVPTSLTGIEVSAMRLRSGSLRIRGIHRYKEFEIPIGAVEQLYVERLIFVYNLGNWSLKFYPLPGYSYLAPVLGLLGYSDSNLSASDLPKLDIRKCMFNSTRPLLYSCGIKCFITSTVALGGEIQGGGKKNMSMLRIVVGRIVLPIILGLLVGGGVRRAKERTKIKEMEYVANSSETLDMTSIGDTKVPLAFGTRTKPMIEHDYYQ